MDGDVAGRSFATRQDPRLRGLLHRRPSGGRAAGADPQRDGHDPAGNDDFDQDRSSLGDEEIGKSMSLRVAVQMDPMESINIAGDSTFAIMIGAQKRGHQLFHYGPESLS